MFRLFRFLAFFFCNNLLSIEQVVLKGKTFFLVFVCYFWSTIYAQILLLHMPSVLFVPKKKKFSMTNIHYPLWSNFDWLKQVISKRNWTKKNKIWWNERKWINKIRKKKTKPKHIYKCIDVDSTATSAWLLHAFFAFLMPLFCFACACYK